MTGFKGTKEANILQPYGLYGRCAAPNRRCQEALYLRNPRSSTSGRVTYPSLVDLISLFACVPTQQGCEAAEVDNLHFSEATFMEAGK